MLAATPTSVIEDNDSRTCLQVITALSPKILTALVTLTLLNSNDENNEGQNFCNQDHLHFRWSLVSGMLSQGS